MRLSENTVINLTQKKVVATANTIEKAEQLKKEFEKNSTDTFTLSRRWYNI